MFNPTSAYFPDRMKVNSRFIKSRNIVFTVGVLCILCKQLQQLWIYSNLIRIIYQHLKCAKAVHIIWAPPPLHFHTTATPLTPPQHHGNTFNTTTTPLTPQQCHTHTTTTPLTPLRHLNTIRTHLTPPQYHTHTTTTPLTLPQHLAHHHHVTDTPTMSLSDAQASTNAYKTAEYIDRYAQVGIASIFSFFVVMAVIVIVTQWRSAQRWGVMMIIHSINTIKVL